MPWAKNGPHAAIFNLCMLDDLRAFSATNEGLSCNILVHFLLGKHQRLQQYLIFQACVHA